MVTPWLEGLGADVHLLRAVLCVTSLPRERPQAARTAMPLGAVRTSPARRSPGANVGAEPLAVLWTAVLFVRVTHSGGDEGLPVGPCAWCLAAGDTPDSARRLSSAGMPEQA